MEVSLAGLRRLEFASGAAGIVIVYDLSPRMAFGGQLAQRSVYTANGRAGLGATYVILSPR
jgi:hypothetical protein